MTRVIKSRLRTKVLVTTKGAGSFEGVLWDFDREAIVLRQTQLVDAGARAMTPVDGELLIFVADVAFIQMI